MDLEIVKELHRLSMDKRFKARWSAIMNSELGLYDKALAQETLLAQSSPLFTIKQEQRDSTKLNLENGDLYIPKYDLYVDLKVSSPNTPDSLCGVVNESSILGFRSDGWYLCINRSFSKCALFPKAELLSRYKNNELKLLGTEPHRYIPSFQYKILDI